MSVDVGNALGPGTPTGKGEGDEPKPGAAGKPKPGLAAKIKANPQAAAGVAGLGGVVVYALVKRSQSGSGTTPAGAASTTTDPNAGQGTYDSSANDVYNSLESQVGAIQDALSQLTPPPAGTTPVTTPSPPAPKPKPKPPAGPYGYVKSQRNFSTVPTLARHFGITSAEFIAYNPQIAANRWDVHALPAGVTFRVPAQPASHLPAATAPHLGQVTHPV